jgi:sugar phosphate isomerase/epimerase
MALPLALQLYSLREDAAQDFPKVLETVAEMGYRGVEFAGLHDHDPEEIAKLVADLGMEAVSAHMGAATEENVNEIADTAKALGLRHVVAGGGPPDFESEDTIGALAQRLETSARLLEPHGLGMGCHNHWWEFDHEVAGRCPHDILMAETEKLFAQLDVYWAAFGGHDPVEVIQRNVGRVNLLHIKDGDLVRNEEGRPANPHTAVGAGKVDIPAVVAAGEAAGTEWLIVELDHCATDMEEAVRESAAYMLSSGLAEGRP